MEFEINYWIVFSEFRIVLLGGPPAAKIQPLHASTGHNALAFWNPRVDFRLVLLVYKVLNGKTPAYISDHLTGFDEQ